MFEVGIKSAQEQLEKIKQEFTKANGELQKLLTLKVSIEGVDTITKALGQIGDSDALRKLRNEVAALNREFSILSKGAGGSGDIAGRGLAADIERTSQSIDRYTSKIKQLTEERSRLIGGTRNSSYQNFTDEILRYEQSLEGARKKLAQLNEQKNQSVASESLKKSTQEAQAFETALGRIETAIGSLKSGMSVNLTGDFSKWAQEVQNVTASVRELVEQFKQLQQVQSKGASTQTTQGGLFDPQKFTTLQDAIDKIISEINRLQQAFTKLGENSSLSNLSTTINGLAVTLSSLSNAVKFTGSADEIAAYEAKVKSLKETIAQLEAQAKQVSDSVTNATKGISAQAEKKGSESTLADNLQRLKSAITDVRSEYNRLNEAYGSAKDMGMPTNNAIEERLYNLRRLITMMEQLAQAAQTAGSAEAEALSRSKAFSFFKFNNNQLFSKETNKLYSKKEIDGYIKSIDEFVKAEGRMAQTSGAATNTIADIGSALGRAAERASQAGNSFSQTAAGIQNFAMNIETARLAYDKTLRGIADLESRISAGQKANMDKESLDFMNGLKQRAQQWADVLKKILGEDMKGNPAYREFLSMSSNILTRPQTGNGLQALLGADWKILLKDIGETFNMLMKFSGFNKSLTLDNATLANWLKGEEAVRRLENALKDLNKQWGATNNEAKTPDLTARYEAQKRAIESLIAQIRGAMTEADRISNRNGLSDLLGVGFKNAVGYDNTRLIQDMRVASRDAAKAEAEYMKEVDKFTEQSKKAYAQAEKEKEKAAQERAKAVAAAEKTVQTEITKTESLQKKVEQSITRGEAAKRDMSGLYAQNAALEQQVRLMEGLKNSISRGTIDPNSDIISKRIKDIQSLREDTELLRKAEEKLTTAREQANRRNDNQQLKNLKDEEKSVNDAFIQYTRLGIKLKEIKELSARGESMKMDVMPLDNYIVRLIRLREILKDLVISGGGRTVSSKTLDDLGLKSGMLTSQLMGSHNVKANILANEGDVRRFKEALSQTEMESAKADANIRKLGMAFNELKNYMKANGGSEEMRKLQAEIQGAIQKMRQLMNVGNFAGAVNVYERMAGSLRQAATATKEFENSQHSLSSTISHTNGNLQNQSQVLSDLKSMAMQYLSVWGAQSFINNIIELGGQLEQQRLSIGAILQDTAQANHLFSQIKDLAIKSPFGVQQLDAMSKQLSAYGFQYSELYEWTKRLADISAATGTSVDRLALALGHVRSEGALSGYTLRQFSMGNIPLLQKLSENLGKTKQEIRKMTRNKEIGYEDVLNVLKQLTDEGGMFFEAQETMAQALNAKFKNLRDSFQIMYSEMAEGAPGDFLKGVATTLTDISRQWRVLMPMILSGAGAMGIWKLATMAMNHELEREGRLLVGNAIATSKYSMSQLRAIATTGRFTLALKGLGRAMMSIGRFIFNPVTLGFAAVEGLIYLWSKHNDEVRKAADLTKAYGETAVESEKNIANQLENIKPFSSGMDDSTLKTGIDSMTESIKNYAINGQSIINGMFDTDSEGKVMSLAEKYQYLRRELEDTIKIYKELKRVKDAFEYGINASDGGWFDDNVETDLTQYAETYKKFLDDVTKYSSQYGNSIEKAIEAAEKADPAFAKATENLERYGDKLIEFWSNSDKYQDAAKYMNNLFGSGAGTNDAEMLTESYFGFLNDRNEAMRELDRFIKETEVKLKEDGYDFSKELAPEQVGALLKMSKDWLEKHPEWENIYDTIKEKLEGRWPIKIVPDASPVEEKLPKWLQDMQTRLNKTGIQLKANMSMEQIIDEMKKAYDQAQTTINKLGPIALKANIDISSITAESIEQYKYPNPQLYQALTEILKANGSKSQLNAESKNMGVKLEGMKKDGTHKAEKQNQEAAKAVREQVRVIKEAADAFEYWREKVGDKGAWEHVQREFGDVLKKIGITAQNIWDVRSHLNRIPKSKEYKAITDKKVKTETDKEIAKVNDQFFRKDFEKNAKEFTSSMQMQIDDLTQKWEIFKSVVSATGDELLAQRLSGVTPGATPADLKRLNVSSATGVDIDFDKVLGMSDKEIDEYVTTLGLAEDRIDEIRLGLKDWKKAQKDVSKSDIESYARWLGSLVDIQSVRNRNEMEYQDIVRETNRLLAEGRITQEEAERRIRSAAITRDTKNSQATATYSMLYNNSLGMAQEELVNILAEEIESLNKQFEAGNISAADYADKISKINQIQREFDMQGFLGIKGGVGAFLGGGSEGLANYYRNRAEAARKRASGYRKGESPEEQDAADKAEQEAKHYESMYTSLIKVTDSAKKVATAFDTLKNGVGLLEDLFANMGNGSAAQAMGDAGDILGGMMSGASSLSALGPYGMAAGAGLGLVSGLFALHDKSIQREIDAIKDQIDATKENTEAIKRARERTLGYDMGVLRDRMSDMYQDTTRKRFSLFGGLIDETDEAKLAMKEYYSLNSRRSGYSAELENLKKEREYYMQIYNLESSKKNVSEEALREYKKQIAELDDQILYFVEDLAKDLWGIDFKAWSEQISDALWTAFENGEDAVQAFHDTADDIIADVAKKMMNIHLIEPVFKTLEDRLFGELNSNGQRVGGVYNEQTGQFDETKTLEILGQFFGENGEFARVINSAEDFYDMTKRVTGFDFSGDSSSSTSAGIKGITEQTADLLASYVNATRASTATIEHLTAQYFPMYYAAMTSGNSSLANIENHTAAIMRSNDIVAEKITSLDNNIIGLKNRTWKVPMV